MGEIITNTKLRALRQALFFTMIALASSQAHSASKVLLVLGDSLSAEYGLSRGSGWVALMEKRIAEKHLKVSVVNASVSGETTSGGKSRLPALLTTHHPDIVLIELGANDALRGLPMKASEQNLRDLIQMCPISKCQAILIGMQIPPNYGKNYTRQFFEMYSRLAQEFHLPLVPFLLSGVADQPQLFQADRMHPNADAHPKILNNVWPVIMPLLK